MSPFLEQTWSGSLFTQAQSYFHSYAPSNSADMSLELS